jgi:hypothetical protein
MFVALGDLNGDGRPDLVVTNALADEQSNFSNLTGSVSVFLSEGSSGYGPARHYVQDDRPTSAAVGDLNGDGKADVALSNFQSATVMLNDGAGTLSAPGGYATGTFPSSIAIGDLNGDGRNDLAVANAGEESRPGDVAVLLNVGNRMFTATNYPAGTRPVHVAIGDLNADGRPDLAVSSGSSVNVLFNQGNGFAPPATYGVGTNPSNAVIADLNGDGRPDLAAGRDFAGAAVILSTGAGVFAAAVVYPLPPAYTQVAIGDLNLDGKPDVVGATGDGFCGAVTFLLNAGNGTFGPFGSIGVNVSPTSVSVGDLNRDGKPDIVVPHSDGVAVLVNAAP